MTEPNALNEDPVTLIERAQRIHVYSNMPSLAHGVIRELVTALQAAETRLRAVSEASGQIISGSPGPLFDMGFSAGVAHIQQIAAKAGETEVEHWKAQAAGEYFKIRDLASSDTKRQSSKGSAPKAAPTGEGDGNTALFPGVPEPLRDDLCFITAALSTYHGGPASEDVQTAWGRITDLLGVEP